MRGYKLRIKKGTSEIIAEVFVDDIKWGTNDEEFLKTIIATMGDQFTTTVGDTPINSKNKDEVDWTKALISTYLKACDTLMTPVLQVNTY